MVIEIVSRGSIQTDYQDKKTEYTSISIPEYWIVDPISEKVTIVSMSDDDLKEQVFIDKDLIQSEIFPQLLLTPQGIFAA